MTFEFIRFEGEYLTDWDKICQVIGFCAFGLTSTPAEGIFDDVLAAEMCQILSDGIMADQPRLGLATTRELFDELIARLPQIDGQRVIQAYSYLTKAELDYRTAGDHV